MKKFFLIISILLNTNLLLNGMEYGSSLKKVKYSSVKLEPKEYISKVKSLKVQSGLAVIKRLINLKEENLEHELNRLSDDLRKYLTYLLNNPKIYSKLDRTFLHRAKSAIQVKNLIKLGININKKDKLKNTALNWLYQNEKDEASNELLKYVKKDIPNNFGISALRVATITNPENFEEIFKISPNCNVSKGSCSGINLLSYVASKGSFELLKFLLDNETINLNGRNENGTSLLMNAITNKSAKVAKYLLENKITDEYINKVNSYDSTALMFACHYHPKVARDLLFNSKVTPEHINKVNNGGFTALMFACKYQPEAVKYLLADDRVSTGHIYRVSENGSTALMFACEYQPKAVKYLLSDKRFTAEYINKANNDGSTALMIAFCCHQEALDLLLADKRVIRKYINKTSIEK